MSSHEFDNLDTLNSDKTINNPIFPQQPDPVDSGYYSDPFSELPSKMIVSVMHRPEFQFNLLVPSSRQMAGNNIKRTRDVSYAISNLNFLTGVILFRALII